MTGGSFIKLFLRRKSMSRAKRRHDDDGTNDKDDKNKRKEKKNVGNGDGDDAVITELQSPSLHSVDKRVKLSLGVKSEETQPASYRYIEQDLFKLPPHEYSYVHAVSADFNMGKGIAVEFKRMFGRQAQLLKQNVQVGGVATLVLRDKQQRRVIVFYLVTKQRYFGKPTMSTMESSLKALKIECERLGVRQLAMPKIGSGLDRLEWEKVSQLIQSILVVPAGGIDVTVCYR